MPEAIGRVANTPLPSMLERLMVIGMGSGMGGGARFYGSRAPSLLPDRTSRFRARGSSAVPRSGQTRPSIGMRTVCRQSTTSAKALFARNKSGCPGGFAQDVSPLPDTLSRLHARLLADCITKPLIQKELPVHGIEFAVLWKNKDREVG